LQVRIAGFRVSQPSERAYAFVFVTVNRNPTTPYFTRSPFYFNISENQALGDSFGAVTAVDPDSVSWE
jgi:hypothetical protein